MRYLSTALLFILAAALFSCTDEEKERQAETVRSAKYNDSIFKIISSNWKFDVPPLSQRVAPRISTWNEWRQFKAELAQKPTGTINAYRQKTRDLAHNADNLKNNIPSFFNKPQVRSRMGVLSTKIRSLYTYISLDVIQDKKVLALIKETSRELTSLQDQMDEMVRISEIPKEFGEEEMLRALDTTRMANPDIQNKTVPQAPSNTTTQSPFTGLSRNRAGK